MFLSRFMPCPDCGASLDQRESGVHRCDHQRWLDYQLFQLRDEVEAFERELGAYLATPRGRFELWYAQRKRRARDRP